MLGIAMTAGCGFKPAGLDKTAVGSGQYEGTENAVTNASTNALTNAVTNAVTNPGRSRSPSGTVVRDAWCPATEARSANAGSP